MSDKGQQLLQINHPPQLRVIIGVFVVITFLGLFTSSSDSAALTAVCWQGSIPTSYFKQFGAQCDEAEDNEDHVALFQNLSSRGYMPPEKIREIVGKRCLRDKPVPTDERDFGCVNGFCNCRHSYQVPVEDKNDPFGVKCLSVFGGICGKDEDCHGQNPGGQSCVVMNNQTLNGLEASKIKIIFEEEQKARDEVGGDEIKKINNPWFYNLRCTCPNPGVGDCLKKGREKGPPPFVIPPPPIDLTIDPNLISCIDFGARGTRRGAADLLIEPLDGLTLTLTLTSWIIGNYLY